MAKLLLVEDDNNLREIYEARLQAEGYTIVSAKDGEEALVVAKAEKPDLVISDVMMPKISGFEMLDIMRNTDELKHVKVIMLTALGQSDDQQRADKLGADRYLVKSQVTLEDIVKVAHELLEGEGGGAAPAATAPADDAVKTDSPAAAPTDDKPAEEPAAAAEPVKEEPKPEPAAEPAPAPELEVKPEPATEPVAEESKEAPQEEPKPAPDDTASKDAAEPAAEEKADVEAKIEDFVAGASSEPTAPAEAEAAPASGSEKTAADTASDDKLMADAVEKLSASTDESKDKSAEPAGDAAPSAPAAPAATTIPVSAPADDKDSKPTAATPPEAAASGSMTHEKVIAPPESSEEPKKDIKELLAEEADPEDKPSGAAPGSSVAPTTGPDTKGKDGVDPNSIAL